MENSKFPYKTEDLRECENDPSATLDQFRSQLVNKALILFAWLAIPLLAVSLYRIGSIGWQHIFALHIGSAICAIGIALFRKQLTYNTRVLIVFLLWMMISFSGILTLGLASGGVPIVICLSFAITMAYDWRWGLVVVGICGIFVTTMGILCGLQIYTFDVDFNLLMRTKSHWIVYVLLIFLWGAITVFGVGRVIQYLVCSLDLLRQSQESYKNIFNGVTDAIFIHDTRTGKVVDVNEQMLRMYGCERDDVVGTDGSQFGSGVAPYDMAQIEKKTATVLNSDGPVSFEWHARKKDGALFWAYVTLERLLIGNQIRILSVVRDITEQKMSHEFLIQSEKMMSLGGMAAGLAHEIKSPLSGMMQISQVLSNRLLGNLSKNQEIAEETGADLIRIKKYMEQRKIPGMLSELQNAGARMEQIIADMLSFARKSETIKERYELPLLVEQTLNIACTEYDLKKEYQFSQIRIEKKYADNLPPVMCEAGKIKQVIFNILKNGAEAMWDFCHDMGEREPTFVIEIMNLPEEKHVKMVISDNGPGMPKEVMAHIFEPFFTTKEVGRGTGLGLSVSYFIVTENHGGKMSVCSSPGGGTSFTVILPWEQLDN